MRSTKKATNNIFDYFWLPSGLQRFNVNLSSINLLLSCTVTRNEKSFNVMNVVVSREWNSLIIEKKRVTVRITFVKGTFFREKQSYFLGGREVYRVCSSCTTASDCPCHPLIVQKINYRIRNRTITNCFSLYRKHISPLCSVAPFYFSKHLIYHFKGW